MTKRRDPAEWVAYGQPGPGRPRISTEVEAVSATIPRADAEALDAAAARRGLRRPDMLRGITTTARSRTMRDDRRPGR
jgi:hypothetical protein